MKKAVLFILAIIALTSYSHAQQYEYKIITSVESLVANGVGKSMLVEANETLDVTKISADRENGKSKHSSVKSKDVKVENITETKLLNYYSATGINFQNIASNDAAITSKINAVTKEGWELAFITSGVESDSGDKDGKGIYITRYVFKRLAPQVAPQQP